MPGRTPYPTSDTSALSPKKRIYSFFSKCGLSPHMIWRQGCHEASNMRCAFNGLKTLIMKELTLLFVANNHSVINDFFELISHLLNMIGSSYKCRYMLREKQSTKMLQTLAAVGLKRPGNTHWGSHYSSLVNNKGIYSSICEVLQDIIKYSNSEDHKADACRLLKLLQTFDFIFCLHLMVDILGVINDLNTTLQKKEPNIVKAK
uniref:Uncharacterized protein n=1 Tax=Lactuca sativa TaxID=4236 RepID=A0A9R1WGT0_LACSA|nr:hypothetical protein LSAT_V11C100039870 [Lactuca sativa]